MYFFLYIEGCSVVDLKGLVTLRSHLIRMMVFLSVSAVYVRYKRFIWIDTMQKYVLLYTYAVH